MTLDDAIKHCQDVVTNRKDMCDECRNEHRQLMKWLKELKILKEHASEEKSIDE